MKFIYEIKLKDGSSITCDSIQKVELTPPMDKTGFNSICCYNGDMSSKKDEKFINPENVNKILLIPIYQVF